MIGLLNQELADTTDLYSQTKQAHWNVKGIHFYQLHLLFDQLAEKRQGEADELAERATELGGYALGTVRMAAANSRLPEIPTGINAGADYVQALVERYGIHANGMRAAIDEADEAGDKDTADLFTEISRELDKDLWFLQAASASRRTSRSPALAGYSRDVNVRQARCARPGSDSRQRLDSHGR